MHCWQPHPHSYRITRRSEIERLKKCCGRAAARDFGVLARLSEGACPKRPVTERKRSQNPEAPLLASRPHGDSIFDNALKVIKAACLPNPFYFVGIFCLSQSMDAQLPPLTPGTLYLVATPIGNLEDITLRALRVLRECDVVAAEDTRHSGRLLQHFGISRPMLSYFQFNEARRSEEILERLRRGEKVALVTDAGSPGISDPGERVAAAALAAGLRVEAVPGPCALVAALTASGLPAREFHFVGFLPHKSGQRQQQLE